MTFAKGQKVTQVLPAPISGEVAGFAVDQQTGALQVQVKWTDAEGHDHARFFSASELQVTPKQD